MLIDLLQQHCCRLCLEGSLRMLTAAFSLCICLMPLMTDI